MVRLAMWQFRYTWMSWIGALIIFLASGFVIGFTIIGVDSTIKAKLNYGNFNPVGLFLTPAIFGLITLTLLINGITRLVINKFKNDYDLWSLLGANSIQLSVMISIQMGLTGMIGGLLGYFMAYPIVNIFYNWIRTNPGMTEFPEFNMRLHYESLILSVMILSILIGITGFISGEKVFLNMNKRHKIINELYLFSHFIWTIVIYGGLIYVYSLFFKSPRKIIKLLGDQTIENTYLQILLILAILMIIAMNEIERVILPMFVKVLQYWIPTKLMKTFQTAYWNVLEKKEFLRTLTLPSFIFSLVSSFFMYLAFDLANISNKRSLSEIFGTLLLFLGAPFLIILANTISLTIISSSERSSNISQLSIIGFSVKDLLFEKIGEASIYGSIIFIQGTIGNALLYVPIMQASYYTHTQMKDGWLSITWIPATVGILAFLFIFLVDGIYVYKNYAFKQTIDI
ncbi:FtsX-like permease family protein [Companilactobacillus insicii]|uniref:FtsX-like permease family protein n=1 Tax=Companilactobacillus insicii TaxID=1732567 RepID=UPI000F78DDA7|nr:FtsX-like permease family protein [Companilactobacillus insicii]